MNLDISSLGGVLMKTVITVYYEIIINKRVIFTFPKESWEWFAYI